MPCAPARAGLFEIGAGTEGPPRAAHHDHPSFVIFVPLPGGVDEMVKSRHR